mgnify:CR=1 FL=1
MKLFGKFNEYTISDICLYSTPSHIIKNLTKKSDTEIIVKEYRPKIFKKSITDENGVVIGETEIKQDKTRRHQVVAIQNLGFAKISLYSVSLGYEEIEKLDLKPIDKVIGKEKLELTFEKLTDNFSSRGTTYQIKPVNSPKENK